MVLCGRGGAVKKGQAVDPTESTAESGRGGQEVLEWVMGDQLWAAPGGQETDDRSWNSVGSMEEERRAR